MFDDDFHDDPDAGVGPVELDEDAAVDPLDPEGEGAILEELEVEWEDEEAYADED